METLYTPLLVVHATTGFVALLAGLLAVVIRKSHPMHRWQGLIFFWAMVGVTLTAVVLALHRDNFFLLAIGVFSGYMTWSGRRALRRQPP
ncbi:MAG: hypothetical protein WBA12_00390, partial [Catalinimonas sp.]